MTQEREIISEKVFEGVHYLSLTEAAKGTPYSQEYLSLLARRGKISARKIGRNWFITRKAVAQYLKAHGNDIVAGTPDIRLASEIVPAPVPIVAPQPVQAPSPSVQPAVAFITRPAAGVSRLRSYAYAFIIIALLVTGIATRKSFVTLNFVRVASNTATPTPLASSSLSPAPTLSPLATPPATPQTVINQITYAAPLTRSQVLLAVEDYLRNGLPPQIASQLQGPKGDAGAPGLPGIQGPAGFNVGSVPSVNGLGGGTIGGVTYFGAKEVTTELLNVTGNTTLASLVADSATFNSLTATSANFGTSTISALTVTGQSLLAATSVSANFEVAGTASAAATFGSGLMACANANDKLLWNGVTGKFSCGADQTGGSGGAGSLSFKEGSGGSFTAVSSIQFSSGGFNLSFNGAFASVSLDYTNGPASRGMSNTWTALNVFGAGASVASNFEVSGIASVSQLYIHGSAFVPPIGNSVTSNSLDFDEFVNSMNLDANTTVASHGFSLNFGNTTLTAGTILPDMTGAVGTLSYQTIGTPAQWYRDIYAESLHLGSNSLYMNGTRVLYEQGTIMRFTTDPDQTLALGTFGTGNLVLHSQGTGNLQLLSTQGILASSSGGITLNVPASVGGGNINITNESLGGDISLNSSGIGSNVFVSAVSDILLTAPTTTVSGNAKISGYASASQLFGSGLTNCSGKLLWTNGTFSCGADAGASGSSIAISETGSTFQSASSLSFAAGQFNVSYSSPTSLVSLDWGLGGPASRATSNTWTALNVFSAGASISTNLEISGTASAARVLVGEGSASAPSIASQRYPSTGMLFDGQFGATYITSAGNFMFSVFPSGIGTWGNILPAVDGTQAIGAAATRWGNIFLINASVSSSIEVAGTASASTLLAGNGNSAAPSIAFSGSTNTGIYRNAAIDTGQAMTFVAGGVPVMTVNNATSEYDINFRGGSTAFVGWNDGNMNSNADAVFQRLSAGQLTYTARGSNPATLIVKAGAVQGGTALQLWNNSAGVTLASISATGAFDTTAFASASQYFGGGLSACSGTNAKLLWDSATGRFSCGTDIGSTSGALIDVNTSGGGPEQLVSSLSFNNAHFVLSFVPPHVDIGLNWGLGGPASRAMSNTWTALNVFSAGASVSTNLEVAGIASIGGNAYVMGNVGIGTTSPASNLQVGAATAASSTVVRIQNASGVDLNPTLELFRTGQSVAFMSYIQAADSNNRILFGNDPANFTRAGLLAQTKFVFDVGSGNLGVGSTTPEQKLDVAGNILASSSGNVSLTLRSTTATGTDGQFSILTASTSDRLDIRGGTGTLADTFMSVASTGNVGVGTTAPAFKLDVVGSIRTSALVSSGSLAFVGGSNGALREDANVFVGLNADGSRMLALKATAAQPYPSFTFEGPTGTVESGFQRGGTGIVSFTAATEIDFNQNGGTRRMTINSGGIGIGTFTPSATLAIAGTASISGQLSLWNSASVSGNFELTGTVSSNWSPTITNAFSLGTSALRWSNLFATNASISGTLEASIASVSQLYIAGTPFTPGIFSSSSANFDPAIDNTYSLGDPTYRWKSVNIGPGSLHISSTTGTSGAGANYTDGVLQFTSGSSLSLGTSAVGSGLAGSVELRTGNTARMFVSSGGNIGIGTTTPGGKFVIPTGAVAFGTANPASNIFLTVGPGTDTTVLGPQLYVTNNGAAIFSLRDSANDVETFLYSGTSGNDAGSILGSLTTHPLVLRAGNATGLVLTPTSAVGIGLDNRTPDATLDVKGTILASTSGNVDVVLRSSTATGDDGKFTLRSAGASDLFQIMGGTTPTALMTVASVGNVGIGTTTPAQQLEVSSTVNNVTARITSFNVAGLDLYSTVGSRNWRLATNSTTGGDFDIFRSTVAGGAPTTTVIHGDPSGNVGFGMTNPGAVLSVNGTASISGNFGVNSSKFYVNGATGNVGIGTKNLTTNAFELVGAASISGQLSVWNSASISANLEAGYASLSNTLWVSPPGYAGNVGVGTVAPSAKFAVNGDVLITNSSAGTLIKTGAAINKGLVVRGFVGTDLFTATSLSGLQLWFKADSIGQSDGTAVSSWSDSSGNNSTATQGSAPLQPVYKTNILNGLPVVRFAGTARMTGTSNIIQPVTTCAVAIRTGPGNSYILDGGSNQNILYSGTTTAWGVYSGVVLTVTVSDNTNVPTVLCGVLNGGSSIISANGTAASGNAGSAAGTGVFTLGDYGGTGARFNGDIAEVITYSKALSTSERQQVEGYLAWKYGLQGSLPSNHPYKNAAPTTGAQTANLQEWQDSTSTILSAVDPAGNFGIGKSTPTTALDVAGSASISGNFELSGIASISGPLSITKAGNADLVLNNTQNQDGLFRLRSVGGATTARLDVLGSASQTFMTIASTGNVGIGTTTPGALLNILQTNPGGVPQNNKTTVLIAGQSANSVQNYIALDVVGNVENSNNTNSAVLRVRPSITGGGSCYGGVLGTGGEMVSVYGDSTMDGTNTDNNLLFAVHCSGAAYFLGNVGIGQVNPTALLSIKASVSGAFDPLDIASSSGANMFRVNRSGNVGIGTATTPGRLTILAPGDDNKPVIHLGQSNSAAAGFDFGIDNAVNGALYIRATGDGVNYGNYLGISRTSSQSFFGGQLGVGTATVGRQLEVVGRGTNDIAYFSSTSGGAALFIGKNTYVALGYAATPPARLTIYGGDNNGSMIRIGGSPTADYKIWRETSTGTLRFQGVQDGYTNYEFLNDGGTSLFRILESGNVGINDSTPTATLDIRGSSTWDPFNVASASGTSIFHIAKTGNVGIGDTTPEANFEVVGIASVSQLYIAGSAFTPGSYLPLAGGTLTGNLFGTYASLSGSFEVAGYITNPGTGANSEEFGYLASATGSGATALGRLTLAAGTNSIGVGLSAVSSASGGIAIGQASKVFASSTDAIAIGRAALVDSGSTGAIAIGGLSGSFSGANVVIGFGAEASRTAGGTDVVIGRAAKSYSGYGDTVVIGDNASVDGTGNGVAIGSGAKLMNLGNGSALAIGSSAIAQGGYATALGTSASASSQNTALGYLAVATGGIQSVAVGMGANAISVAATAVGGSAAASSSYATAIGNAAEAAASSVAVGATTHALTQSIAMGYATNVLATAIGIGYASNVSTSAIGIGYTASVGANSIGLGYQVEARPNTFVAGGSLVPTNDVYFGKGIDNVTPTAYTINGTAGAGTDVAGANLQLAGGRGTGTGAGGSLIFQTAAASTTGSTPNTLTTRLTIDSTGRALFANNVSVSGNFEASSNLTNHTLFVSTAGNQVGIGTNNLGTDKLEIVGTASVSSALKINGSSSGYNGGELILNGGAGTENAISTSATGAPIMEFDHRGTSNTGAWRWRNGTGAATIVMALTATGQLSVNGTAPSVTLADTGAETFQIQSTGGAFRILDNTRNNTDRFHILGTGNVGINIAAPTATFEVRGSIAFDPFNVSSTSTNSMFRVAKTGNVGIGTNAPGYKLDVTAPDHDGIAIRSAGTALLRSYPSAGGAFIIDNFSNTGIYFSNATVPQLVLTQGGNLGVGTMTPTATLAVAGTASISGQFNLWNSASISSNLEAAGYASASATFGSGLADCANGTTSKLLWTASTGKFSCGTDQTGGGTGTFTGLLMGEGATTPSHITTLTFDAGAFNLSPVASTATLRLDYTNGPASRAMTNTWTALNVFSAGASVSTQLEIGSYSGAVGTTSPLKIQVDAAGTGIAISQSSTEYTRFVSGGIVKGVLGSGAVPLVFDNGANAVALQYSGVGNVGIGNTTPDARLDVTGNILASTSGNVDLTLKSTSHQDAQFTLRSLSDGTGLSILGSGSQTLVKVASSGSIQIGEFITSTVGTDTRIQMRSDNLVTIMNVAGSAWRNLALGILQAYGGLTSYGGTNYLNGVTGIGTSTPDQKLDVVGNILASTSGNVSLTLRSTTATGTDGTFSILTASTSDRLDFRGGLGTLANTFMSIASSGNVGIGTTTPAAKLYVSTATTTEDAIVTNAVIKGNIIGATNSVGIANGGIFMSDGGNALKLVDWSTASILQHLSMGGASVSANLEVSGTTSASATFGSGLTSCSDGTNSKLLWNSATGKFSCGTDQGGAASRPASNSLDFDELVNAMTLDANTTIASAGFTLGMTNNLGVGTFTPDAKLDVKGNILASASGNVTLTLRSTNATGTDGQFSILTASTSDRLDFRGGAGTLANTFMSIASTGNVGIGTTSPASLLNISASSPEFRITDTASTYARMTKTSANNTYTLYNRALSVGSTGFATTTNGSSQYGIAAVNMSAYTGLSVEMWVKRTSGAATKGIYQVANALNSGSPFLLLQDENGTLKYYINGGYNISPGTISDGVWTHMVITWDGTNWIAYVNGSPAGSTYVSATPLNKANGTSFYVGNGYNGYWNGSFDEVRVYNRPLSPTEVSNHYFGGVGTYGSAETGLTAGYHMDENAGTDAADYSGNGLTMSFAAANVTWSTGKVNTPSALADVTLVRGANAVYAGENGLVQLGDGTATLQEYGTLQQFFIGANEKMRLDANGNVGIGTTGPTATLHVVGNTSTLFNVASGSNSRFMVLESGNVGIGAAGPESKLDVAGNILASTSGNVSLTLRSTSANGNDGTFNILTASTSDRLDFRGGAGTLANTFMSIASTGNIGIGTVAPGVKLHLRGTGDGVAIRGTDSSNNQILYNLAEAEGSGAYLQMVNAANANTLWLSSYGDSYFNGGNLGIGTATVETKLEVVGVASISGDLTIGGNAGIGTSNPGSKLEVFGASRPAITISDGSTAKARFFRAVSGGRLDLASNLSYNGAWNEDDTSKAGVLMTMLDAGDFGFWTTPVAGNPQTLKQVMYTTNAGYTTLGSTAVTDGTVLTLTDANGSCTHNPGAATEAVVCSSDVKLKTNIRDAASVTDYLNSFRIRDYTVINGNVPMTGVIAQEVQQLHPELVTEVAPGILGVQQPNPWILLKGIQELDAKDSQQYPSSVDVRAGMIVVPSSTSFVIMANNEKAPRMTPAARAYASALMGVIASSSTVSADAQTVIMSGHAKVLVSLQNGPIAVGDRITSSGVAGVGMRANTAGQVVGVATEPLDTVATGSYAEIDVFVNPGYWAPTMTTDQPIASGSWQSTTFPNLFAMIVDAFKSLLNITMSNGLIQTIKGIFTEVQTDKLCIGTTCVNEQQLQELLKAQGMSPVPMSSPTATTSPSPLVSTDISPAPTASSSATPTPPATGGSATATPTPDVTVTPTPADSGTPLASESPTPTPDVPTPTPDAIVPTSTP